MISIHIPDHIQLAQVPNRHQPNHAGELNYNYILKLINETNSNWIIGAEYIPSTSTTVDSFDWISMYGMTFE